MTGPLIGAEELRERLGDVTLLDVRYRLGESQGPPAHEAGHIPGAAYVDLETELAGAAGPGGRHPLPTPGRFTDAMQRAGVSNGRPVVVYDDWSGHAAARAWWLLRHHGHRDVRVLDGGWPAWVAHGGAIETGAVAPVPGDFSGAPGAMPVVDADAASRVAVLIDARAPERYRGEVEPVDPVAGRIPGAHNVPSLRNLDNHGHFRDPRELARVYAEVGAVAGADVAVYCGSGVTAAHDVLALELAGVRAALYPGSWSHWITDPQRPVATGPSTHQ
ncbi:sulfurtransferase [Nocardioides limicola]|uniref:sulfurtransferase n=1 Tax=Nocardioides limicola TaxID=2803368 RepID=UPI00193B1A9D|nr:sulfurtransferase [Nocardioides sp. DJM-14]